MKNVFMILFSFLLFSCTNNNTSKKDEKKDTILLSKFENFCYSFYQIKDDCYKEKNEILLDKCTERIDKIFEDTLRVLYKDTIYSDYPLDVRGIKEYKGKYYIQFCSEYSPLNQNLNNDKIKVMFNIIAELSESEMRNFDDSKDYLIKGEFVKMIPYTYPTSPILSSETYFYKGILGKPQRVTFIYIGNNIQQIGPNFKDVILAECGTALIKNVTYKVYDGKMYNTENRRSGIFIKKNN